MNKKIILGLLILFFFSDLKSQEYNIGVPIIKAFSKEESRAGAQNWDMEQDEYGVMYFANNDGMLVFDGTTWTLFPLPNYTIVRSLGRSEQGIIYAGGQNEFGRFIPDEKGVWQFESLRDLVPEIHRNFTDVWSIEVIGDAVLFNASDKLFYYKNNKIEVFDNGIFTNMRKIGNSNQVFITDSNTGVHFFSNGQIEKIEGSEMFRNIGVEDIIQTKGGLILATLKDGFFRLNDNGVEKWQTDVDDFLKENNIYRATLISGNRIAVGTYYGGLVIIGEDGKSIYHLHKGNGLLSNNFLTMFFDKSQNLWVGLSNGINYIHTNSPFTRIYPDEDQDAIGFSTIIFQNKIYFATNKGVYYTDWQKHYTPSEATNFQMIENSKGQAWGMDIVDDELYLGHNFGGYQINNKNASKFYDLTGAWKIDEFKNHPNQLIIGTYSGISLYKKTENGFNELSPLAELDESCRFVEQDDRGNIWVAHPYRGIFKIKPSADLKNSEIKRLGKKDGLPSDILNHLFKVNDEIVFCGEEGNFSFNYDTEKFEPNFSFNNVFGAKTKVRRLQETPDRNIWFITKDELGILKIDDKGLEKEIRKEVFPFQNQQLNQGHESIYPYQEDNVFITNDRGFIHYHPTDFLNLDSTFHVKLTEVKITSEGDSIVSNGIFFENDQVKIQQPDSQIPTSTYQLNDYFFKFSATDFASADAIQYQYYLEGYENDWSAWHTENIKEYTNLSPGTYAFHLRAKNNSQVVSEILKYQFKVTPPWYKSNLAYFAYWLLALLGLSLIIRIYRKKYFGLKEDHELVVKESNEVIGKLKAEKIETELAFKQRELVSTTLNLVKKNETLTNIKSRLQEIKKLVKESETSTQIEQLIKKLKHEEIQDENWEQVMFHFNQLHQDFFDKLKEDYPTLTPKDLKMCAYLRMNLSTKEMTSLMNVTMRGVEASRYRLRKKFGLQKEQNLTEFLMGF